MTWLSFCARRPGPAWKTGYGTGDRTLAQIEGVVDHSMEGSLASAYSVLDGPAQSSWTFSLPAVGEPIQHYSLEKIPWHAGLPGDRRHDTSLIGNLTLVGKEHEGVAGEPWTGNQTYWSARIDVALRELCPAFGANPPTRRLNMWEHRELSATSCPSGRNPWNAKFKLINKWEAPPPLEPPAEEEEMAKLIKGPTKKATYTYNGMTKRLLLGTNLADHERLFGEAEVVSDDTIQSIPNAGTSTGGLTAEETVEASQEAMRRGTG